MQETFNVNEPGRMDTADVCPTCHSRVEAIRTEQEAEQVYSSSGKLVVYMPTPDIIYLEPCGHRIKQIILTKERDLCRLYLRSHVDVPSDAEDAK